MRRRRHERKRVETRLKQTLAKQRARAEREAALAAATINASQALGSTLYGVLYVDPPSRFIARSRQTGLDRAADNHYPTMTLDDLSALQLPAAKDCVLFLWTTAAQLRNAMRLIEHWGFEYKSLHGWKKPISAPAIGCAKISNCC